MSHGKPELNISQISEFIRFKSCLRRAKLSESREQLRREVPFYGRLENPLDIVLQEKGDLAEQGWEDMLQDKGFIELVPADPDGLDINYVLDALASADINEKYYVREVWLKGEVQSFLIKGRVDFLLFYRDATDTLRIRIVESKASRKDQTYQRIQAAGYFFMALQLISSQSRSWAGCSLSSAELDAVVVRIDDETRQLEDLVDLPALDLAVAVDDFVHLLAERGPFAKALSQEIEDLPYQLDSKCDMCVFNVHCFPESARLGKVELLGVKPTLSKALGNHGVSTVQQLAALDLDSSIAQTIASDERVDTGLDVLVQKAKSRLATLRWDNADAGYPVSEITPPRAKSLRPPHEIKGQRLIRVYMNVDYDYIEDRVISVAAHVTDSDCEIVTPWEENDEGRLQPSPSLFEKERFKKKDANPPAQTRDVVGIDIKQVKLSPWSKSLVDDSAAERTMLESFFREMSKAIYDLSTTDDVYLHFYVWTEKEFKHLMEAVSRGGKGLLSSVSQLFGCRDGKEQLIVTALQTDVHRRFSLGWTSKGLTVATALSWFGQRFHWTRQVGRQLIDFSHIFRQDVFDFTQRLQLNNGEWSKEGEPGDYYQIELRSRFYDSTSLAYYRCLWSTLSSVDPQWAKDKKKRDTIERYERVNQIPGLLDQYLIARTHALRWIDERAGSTNWQIEKTPIDLNIRGFNLGSNSPREAAIDVLRIDWAVKKMEWLSAQTLSIRDRVLSGRCLPMKIESIDTEPDGWSYRICASIVPEQVGLTLEDIRNIYSERSRVRVMGWSGNQHDTADPSQAACGWLQNIDWSTGTVLIGGMRGISGKDKASGRNVPYRLFSSPRTVFEELEFLVLEESITDSVYPKIDARLIAAARNPIDQWFDIEDPRIPPLDSLDPSIESRLEKGVRAWIMPSIGYGLLPEQAQAVMDSLNTRVFALQGPPGTGKTATTAVAIAARITARLQPKDRAIVTGNTHLAVDELANRTANCLHSVTKSLSASGLVVPAITLVRLDPKDPDDLDASIEILHTADYPTKKLAEPKLNSYAEGVVVFFGTSTALLKLQKALGKHALNAKDMIVDEASMLVFPQMLAVATLMGPDATMLLAGDNRQLAPILAHPWDLEDRPPSVRYQPFLSSYEVVSRIHDFLQIKPRPNTIKTARLRHTFRLPPATRKLVGTLYKRDDNLYLEGREEHPGPIPANPLAQLSSVWRDQTGLVLVLHTEAESKKQNELERKIISMSLDSLNGEDKPSVAILSPHRHQCSFLEDEIGSREYIRVISTVEKLQGGEAEVVFFSATASDPSVVSSLEGFLLDVHRANVAFSRNKERLIVIAAESLVNHVSSNIDVYDSAVLWKTMRSDCHNCIEEFELDGSRVRVLVPDQPKGDEEHEASDSDDIDASPTESSRERLGQKSLF